MYALDTRRPRSQSQSQPYPPDAQYPTSEFYMLDGASGSSAAISRPYRPIDQPPDGFFSPETSSSSNFYDAPGHNLPFAIRDGGSSTTFSQSYDRRNTSPSDFPAQILYPTQQERERNMIPSVSHLKRGDIPPMLDTYSMGVTNSVYQSGPSSALTAHSDHSGDSESWSSALKTPATELSKPRKSRREKPRIALAPDQPPTTQGRPRARVYVACLQCRTRKIRCDGAKPVCHNCSRRTSGSECNYDPIPKRRGPDRTPGARQRLAREARNELENGGLPARRRRRARSDTADKPRDTERLVNRQNFLPEQMAEGATLLPTPIMLSPPSSAETTSTSAKFYNSPASAGQISDFASLPEYVQPNPTKDTLRDLPSICSTSTLPVQEVPINRNSAISINNNSSYHDAFNLSSSMSYGSGIRQSYVAEIDENGEEQRDSANPEISAQPSLEFTRKIWWDSLLSLYTSPNSSYIRYLTTSQRESAAQSITNDLRFIFRESSYWFSFFHVPSFFGNFFDPVRRERMQPSLILALLTMSTFFQSSEVGLGKEGRERALRFRDEAQGALEASVSTGWIDETLAQAAWLLALFEVCAHPLHSTERSTSALVMLDSIIRSLNLTMIDADDPNASMFARGTVPIVGSSAGNYGNHSDTFQRDQSSSVGDDGPSECSCRSLAQSSHWHSAKEYTPLWGATPAWNNSWSEAEIRKESCRRLCWTSLITAAGHLSYTTASRSEVLDLFIADPANYALLFSGESIANSLGSQHSSKDTVWALHDRSFLLWHTCLRMRSEPEISDSSKADFAIKAWLQADALEAALNRHTCGLERAFIYLAREYIFNSRMFISHEFRRFIPLATANVNGLFHRSKAEEWLSHQATVSRRFMLGLHTITGNTNNLLARRPFFVFWFMAQISRSLSLWQYDPSLTIAWDVCKGLIPAIDYLTALWPCPEQRHRYEALRERMINACYAAGVAPPIMAPNLKLPSPPSPEALV